MSKYGKKKTTKGENHRARDFLEGPYPKEVERFSGV